MENSTNKENINQPADDKHLNIETVTPETENITPLSRQKPSEDPSVHEENVNTVPAQDTSDNAQNPDSEVTSASAEGTKENGNDEENVESVENIESEKTENDTISADNSHDPGDDIETVSP